jgi:hypothetical protein
LAKIRPPDGFDFTVLEGLYSPSAIITVLSRDGILLAANRATVDSAQCTLESIGRHTNEVFAGYDFDIMLRRMCEFVIDSGSALFVDRIYPHGQLILIRVGQHLHRVEHRGRPVLASVSLPIHDYWTDLFRRYDRRRREFPLVIGGGEALSVAELETMYWVQRLTSTAEIAATINRTEGAVRHREHQLAQKIQRIAEHEQIYFTLPKQLPALKSLIREWPISDVLLAGAVNALNKYFGDLSIKIQGFDASREEEYIDRQQNRARGSPRQLFIAAIERALK